MYIISLCAAVLNHTWALARSKPGTVFFFFFRFAFFSCTHCRMTNKNLWIERVFQGRLFNRSFTPNTEGRGTKKDKRQNSTRQNKNHKLAEFMILCCFLCDEALPELKNNNSWVVKSQERVSVFPKVFETESTARKRLWSETERNCTQGSMRFSSDRLNTCILVRHPGPEKPKHNHVSIIIIILFFFN